MPWQAYGPTFGQVLDKVFALTNANHHKCSTVEHLLLVILDNSEVANIMNACGVNIATLRFQLAQHISTSPQPCRSLYPPQNDGVGVASTLYQVFKRAIFRVYGSSRKENDQKRKPIEESDLLYAIFSEPYSYALDFLTAQKLTKYDVAIYLSHGLDKVNSKHLRMATSCPLQNNLNTPKRLQKIILVNDDFTPIKFVTYIIVKIFNKTLEEATAITYSVHNHGAAECGVYTYETAKEKCLEVHRFAYLNQHPLYCRMENK